MAEAVTANDSGAERRLDGPGRRKSTCLPASSSSPSSSRCSAGSLVSTRASSLNPARLQIIILQVSIVGIIAIGVTQVIITGGIDLSSGSVVGATAMIAMSFAQVEHLSRGPSTRSSHRPAGHRADRRRTRLRPGCRAHQRRSHRLHQDPAVHRHARHDGDARAASPTGRPRASRSRFRPRATPQIGSGIRPVIIFIVAGDPLPAHPALHALRQAHLRHRLQRERGADVRHQGRAPQDPGLHDRRHPLGGRRHRRFVAAT